MARPEKAVKITETAVQHSDFSRFPQGRLFHFFHTGPRILSCLRRTGSPQAQNCRFIQTTQFVQDYSGYNQENAYGNR
jgi:hypothetical protein